MYLSRLLPIRRHALLASVAAVALSGPALAAEDADEGMLSEVIVTAEKRETNLQKTPVAASVLGAEQLADRRIQSLADLTTSPAEMQASASTSTGSTWDGPRASAPRSTTSSGSKC